MTRKEKINRNIGLTFDFIRQVADNPELLNNIPDGSVLEFVEKDFKTVEKKKSTTKNNSHKKSSTKYLRVKSELVLIG
ncbi:MAG: hypothetical protein ABI723_05910 [Bacteroidia bacterium]